MAAPFTPLGEMSRRETVYRAISHLPSEELIPYDALTRMTSYDLETIRGLRDSVAKTFEREQKRHVVCLPKQGWKIVRGSAQVEQATRKRRAATRRLGRAVQIIESTDRREMSAEERVRADSELINTTTGYGVLRGLAVKRPSIEDIQTWQEQHANGH